MTEQGHGDAAKATELADLFCRNARRKVSRLFHDLWFNDEVRKYKLAQRVLAGDHAWLEQGILGLDDQSAAGRSLKPEPAFGPADPKPIPEARPVGTH